MEKLGLNFTKLENVAFINASSINSSIKVTYKELLKEVIKTTLIVEEFQPLKKSTIGILASAKDSALIPLTLGILEASHPFCYLPSNDDLRTDLIDFNSRHFFSTRKISQSHFKLLKTFKVLGDEIFFYKLDIVRNLRTFEDADDEMFQLCYVIKTSGTSGRRKMVHVTFNSIKPNITSLQNIFQLNQNDTILSVSPVTFDPFIIDLFLALYAGASIMFVSDSLRFDASLFHATGGPTFLQTTPTLFQQYGSENIKRVLGDASSLR